MEVCYALGMANVVVHTVHTTARAMAPPDAHIPGPLWSIISLITKAHGVWDWYRWGDVYSNPNNFHALVAGHAVNLIVGDSLLVRIAAQCVLIAARILACVEQIRIVAQAYRNWINALTGQRYTITKVRWDKGIDKTSFATATLRWWKDAFMSVVDRIVRIAVATFMLFKEMFILSMRFMDAIKAFSMSPEKQNEAVNELFVNGGLFVDKMVTEQQALVDYLSDKDNEEFVGNILTGIGSKYTVENLIDAASSGLSAAQSVQSVVDYGGGIVKDFGKHAIWGLYAGCGIARYAPTCIIPDPVAPWDKEDPKPVTVSTPRTPISAHTKQLQLQWKKVATV